MSNFNRSRLLIVAIIICAVFVNGYVLVDNIRFPEKTAQDIARYERRFIELSRHLQLRGVIGFTTDVGKNEEREDPDFRKLSAQYSLAPVIIVESLDYPLVAGHFRNPSPDLETYRQLGLIRLRDFGNGIILFRHESR